MAIHELVEAVLVDVTERDRALKLEGIQHFARLAR